MQKGWFKIDAHYDGDRTIDEQLTGLDLVCERAKGKTVLDLGCAEGLIGLHLLDRCGASLLHGFSLVPSEIMAARHLGWGRENAAFHVLDLNLLDKAIAWKPPVLLPRYDTVLLLSVLHKLETPVGILEHVLPLVNGLLAVRLPAPVINDGRSGNVKFDARKWLSERCALIAEPIGPRNEWMGIFEK